jgi:hypothetical protein
MNLQHSMRIMLILGLFLFLSLGTLGVNQLNEKAGGDWSARDMWDYLKDAAAGRKWKSKHSLYQLSLARLTEEEQADLGSPDGFSFPDDRAGQILAKTLPPSEKSPTGHDAPAPRRLPPPAHLDKPSLPLPPSQADMPRLPAGKTPSLRPRPLPEELPLISHKTDPLVPEVQYLHAGDRVRLHSVDVNKPIPLPILAQPVGSRSPLDDATTDASLAAALAATPPARATPAPFLKLTLPDPFENRLKPPTVADENIAPAHTGSRPGH